MSGCSIELIGLVNYSDAKSAQKVKYTKLEHCFFGMNIDDYDNCLFTLQFYVKFPNNKFKCIFPVKRKVKKGITTKKSMR